MDNLEFIALLGGIPAILTAVIGYVSSIFLERMKASFASIVEAEKAEIQAQLKRQEASFKHSFGVYVELWDNVALLQSHIRDIVFFGQRAEGPEFDAMVEKYAAFDNQAALLRKLTKRHAPFYSEEIANDLKEILDLSRNLKENNIRWRRRRADEYAEKGLDIDILHASEAKAWNDLLKIISKVENKIRKISNE